jgi:hypothetical protein
VPENIQCGFGFFFLFFSTVKEHSLRVYGALTRQTCFCWWYESTIRALFVQKFTWRRWKRTRNRHQERQFPERDSNPEPPEHNASVQTTVSQYSGRRARLTLHGDKSVQETSCGNTYGRYSLKRGSEKYVTEVTDCTFRRR